MDGSEIDYEVFRIPDDDRIKSIRGFYQVVARSDPHLAFAICATEEEARHKARQRLLYAMNGYR